ncbi:MAG: fructose-1,6-bisphosphatase [Oscillospiraceae bacterium]|nr:fructose-1,6-bisphosphatase [Oscillospiraceae bacterium]
MNESSFDEKTLKYLKMLSRTYPTTQSVSTEIINLRAILNLPKGTEHFISDIHGEYEGFRHILRNASGSVRRKIDQALGEYVSSADRDTLATLIYYPEQKLRQLRHTGCLTREWYTITLRQLVAVCRITTSKYTASKVRKMLPKDFEYIITELMTTGSKDFNKEQYYGQIIDSIIDIDAADKFIIAMCHLVQDSVIDKLHVVGDIYDRGDSPHLVMDELEQQRYVDIQWGNHDILWMGAAAGNRGCIANAVRICLRYNNYDFLESGYGINMRPLSLFALETYADDPCACFKPKGTAGADSDAVIAKMHKAISIIQFKVEGQYAMTRPEYEMTDRLLLDKMDLKRGVVTVAGEEYPLLDTHFPTVDPADPYALTPEEQRIMEGLQASFVNCEKLQRHIEFLYKKGSMYRYYNNCLMFHGCIPMQPDGSYTELDVYGVRCHGKSLFDRCEELVRQGRYSKDHEKKKRGADFMWYLWCGSKSPVFGKDKMATFERYFIADKKTHKETSDPYFTLAYTREGTDRLLAEFGIDDPDAVIINGHIPVKIKKGENPIKVEGRLVLIDGGMSKAYQSVTGIAGYTLVSNSHQMYLSEHEPFASMEESVRTNRDMESQYIPVKTYPERVKIADTDDGREIISQIEDLEKLLEAYRSGAVKQGRG